MKKLIILTLCISAFFLTAAGCDSSKENDIYNSKDTEIITSVPETESETSAPETTSVPEITIAEKHTTSESKDNKLLTLYKNYTGDAIPEFVNRIEWTEDMIVSSEEEMKQYIEKNLSEHKKEIPFIFNGTYDQNYDSGINDTTEYGIIAHEFEQISLGYMNLKCIYAIYKLEYFPGTEVLDAYRNEDTSSLSPDNLVLYNLAVNYVENVLDSSLTDIEKEKQIHDYICSVTSYYTVEDDDDIKLGNVPRYRTAVGALIDGQSNCMGYTDAFYLLGNMAGLDVIKIVGDEAISHTWNAITLDGKKYIVDVTWADENLGSDGLNNYMYFNAGLDIAQQSYTWDYDNKSMSQIVQSTDENYFYAQNSQDFGYIAESYDEFYNKIIELIEGGQTEFYIAAKNCQVAGDTRDMFDKIFERMETSGSLYGSLYNINGYSFAYITYTQQ